MYSSSLPSTSSGHKDLNSLIQLMERIRAVGIYEQLESNERLSWENFQKQFLLSISIQKLYLQLFTYFQGLQNIKTRDILIAYAFVYYEMDDQQTSENVRRVSQDLIHCIHKEPFDQNYRSKLYHTLHRFEREYVPWRMDDRTKILEKLSHLYWEYEVNWRLYETRLTPEEKAIFLSQKTEKQQECIHMMKRIDNLNFFQQYQPVHVDSQTSELLITILRKAFWDRIKEKLFQTPPDYEPLNSIFTEIREHIQHITRARPNIMIEFDDIMDMDFIRMRQANQSTDLPFWKNRLDYLMDILIKLDSLERKPQHEAYLKDAYERMQNCSIIKDFYEICIEVLAHMMTRLLEIREMYDHVFSTPV